MNKRLAKTNSASFALPLFKTFANPRKQIYSLVLYNDKEKMTSKLNCFFYNRRLLIKFYRFANDKRIVDKSVNNRKREIATDNRGAFLGIIATILLFLPRSNDCFASVKPRASFSDLGSRKMLRLDFSKKHPVLLTKNKVRSVFRLKIFRKRVVHAFRKARLLPNLIVQFDDLLLGRNARIGCGTCIF